MPFSVEELANITNSALDLYMFKRKSFAQNIQQKPFYAALDAASSSELSGGKGRMSFGVHAGQGGLVLQGYTHDDAVTYGNPTPQKRVSFPWYEHFMGLSVTHTELKHDGITVTETSGDYSTSDKDGREEHALNNMLETKLEVMSEDYADQMNRLSWGDGSVDPKSFAGIRAFILDNPALGATGSLNRTTNTWWRNRAATTAANAASTGFAPITSNVANGGALLDFLEKERMQIRRRARGTVRHKCFAGSDFINAMKLEIRANGLYSQSGFGSESSNDGAMASVDSVKFGNWTFQYDPTLDDLSLAKRAYIIDFSKLKLVYMTGEKMKKVRPTRPHDIMAIYQGLSTTCGMIAMQLNTSGVYDIA
jgi:hypothetical protein